MTVSQQTLGRLKRFAADGDSCATAILLILERLEALEAQPPAAQPVPPVAPAGGLVERVVKVIADPDGPAELWHDDARAAIREVAAWLDQQGQRGVRE